MNSEWCNEKRKIYQEYGESERKIGRKKWRMGRRWRWSSHDWKGLRISKSLSCKNVCNKIKWKFNQKNALAQIKMREREKWNRKNTDIYILSTQRKKCTWVCITHIYFTQFDSLGWSERTSVTCRMWASRDDNNNNDSTNGKTANESKGIPWTIHFAIAYNTIKVVHQITCSWYSVTAYMCVCVFKFVSAFTYKCITLYQNEQIDTTTRNHSSIMMMTMMIMIILCTQIKHCEHTLLSGNWIRKNERYTQKRMICPIFLLIQMATVLLQMYYNQVHSTKACTHTR